MKWTVQTVLFSVGLAALGAVAACSSSSSGGGTGDDGGGQDATGGSSGGSSSSGSSSGTASSSGSSSGTSSSSGGSSSGGSSSGGSSSSSGTSSSGGSSSGTASSSGGSSSGASSSGGSSSGGSSGDGGADGGDAGCTMLTVANYFNWCSVSVNGGTASTLATQSVCAPVGSTVHLAASPASSSFELGGAGSPWHKTAGDNGSGDTGSVSGSTSSTTVVAMGASQCVYACCPFSSTSGQPAGSGCSGAGFTSPCP